MKQHASPGAAHSVLVALKALRDMALQLKRGERPSDADLDMIIEETTTLIDRWRAAGAK